MGMNIIVEILLHKKSYIPHGRGNYRIQAYLSSIEPKSLELACNPEFVVLKVDLTP